MPVKIKRIYEPFAPDDGHRILVDRLWPRGIKKEEAKIDQWMKEIAPSTALRKWYHQSPAAHWEQFVKDYIAELKKSDKLEELRSAIDAHKNVTLLFASKDARHNHALVLQQFINS